MTLDNADTDELINEIRTRYDCPEWLRSDVGQRLQMAKALGQKDEYDRIIKGIIFSVAGVDI